MLVLNYGHPMTEKQLEELRENISYVELGSGVEVVDLNSQIDVTAPLLPQVERMVAEAARAIREYKGKGLIVLNPPGLAVSAVTFMYVFANNLGFTPPVVRLRMVDGSLPRRFEVAEVIRLD